MSAKSDDWSDFWESPNGFGGGIASVVWTKIKNAFKPLGWELIKKQEGQNGRME